MSNVYFYAIVASAQFVKEKNPKNDFCQDIFSAVIRKKINTSVPGLLFLSHHSSKLHLNIFRGYYLFLGSKKFHKGEKKLGVIK